VARTSGRNCRRKYNVNHTPSKEEAATDAPADPKSAFYDKGDRQRPAIGMLSCILITTVAMGSCCASSGRRC
jgi:hypothetical protein